jgi:hypothetical protein
MDRKKVIDLINMKCLETFDKSETQKIFEKYFASEKWSGVLLDCDGDIILWEDE